MRIITSGALLRAGKWRRTGDEPNRLYVSRDVMTLIGRECGSSFSCSMQLGCASGFGPGEWNCTGRCDMARQILGPQKRRWHRQDIGRCQMDIPNAAKDLVRHKGQCGSDGGLPPARDSAFDGACPEFRAREFRKTVLFHEVPDLKEEPWPNWLKR